MSDREIIESALQRIAGLENELRELREQLLKLDYPEDGISPPLPDQDDSSEPETGEPDTPFHRLMNGVADLKAAVLQGDYPVFQEFLSFTGKAAQIASGVEEKNSNSRQACRIVFDIIGFHDRISALYCTDGFGSLRTEIQKSVSRCIDFLSSNGYTVSPDDGVDGQLYDPDAHGGTVFPMFSEKAEGTILSVEKHGIRSHEGADQVPSYCISRKTDNRLLTLPGKCYEILIAYHFRNAGEAKMPSDADKIRGWFRSLPGENNPEETALIYVRQILNMFSQIAKKPKIVKKAVESILAVLKEKGFSPIPVPMGGTFDSSFSTSKYERRYIDSDKAKDTIVSVIQYGLTDSSGIPVQKSIIGVSRG